MNTHDKGFSTANFMSSMVKALPPLLEVARMAGVDLPDFLGNIRTPPQTAAPAPKPEKKEHK